MLKISFFLQRIKCNRNILNYRKDGFIKKDGLLRKMGGSSKRYM